MNLTEVQVLERPLEAEKIKYKGYITKDCCCTLRRI
jgi:hypothetical protein